MSLKTKLVENGRSGCIGVVLAVGLGLALLILWRDGGLVGWSFDLLFRFRPSVSLDKLSQVVIVYMDEKSYRELEQSDIWDRRLHAQLLDWLRADGAKLVVFDVFFTEPGSAGGNQELTRAIRDHGGVVLAAALQDESRPGVEGGHLVRPVPEFLAPAAGEGIARVATGGGGVVRQHYVGTGHVPSLPWKVAELNGEPVTRRSDSRFLPRWLNYYGPFGTIPHVSYSEATNQLAGYFRGKIVFVGQRPRTPLRSGEPEAFPIPYTRWDGQHAAGVEILATTFLNLHRGDWLSEAPPWAECLAVILAGAVLGFGLALLSPTWSWVWGAVAALVISSGSILLAWRTHEWFPWMIVCAAQLPSAWIWSVFAYWRQLSRQRNETEAATRQVSSPHPQLPGPALVAEPAGLQSCPNVSDHDVLRCVGLGAYGEVWLARNTIGLYHAVKLVRRNRFPTDAPYEREFKGMQKYMPISLGHPGLVHLLHVGRNDEAGYFFYIMDAGDDEVSDQNIDPAKYVPKNLARELKKRLRLSVGECVDLGLHLSAALEYLHQRQLIHRDIKPANIIYVNGIPKIADIGLVTDLAGKGSEASYLGTEGYIAPEGPGTAAGDVYSLGKVLYEASMGRDRWQFPDLPTSLVEHADHSPLMQLNRLILRACDPDPLRRYQSATELRAGLLQLRTSLGARSEG